MPIASLTSLCLAVALGVPAADDADAAPALVVPRASGGGDVSPDGARLVLTSGRVAWLWDTAAGVPLAGAETVQRDGKRAPSDSLRRLGFSRDGSRWVASGIRGSRLVLDAANGDVRLATGPSHPGRHVDGRMDASGRWLAQHDGERLTVHDLDAGSVRWQMADEQGAGQPRIFALAPDGEALISSDGYQVFWVDLDDAEPAPRVLPGLQAPFERVQFSDDGALAWLEGQHGLSVLDGRDGQLLASRIAPDVDTRVVGALADGSLVIARDADGVLRGLGGRDLAQAWELEGLGVLDLDPRSETLWLRAGREGLRVHDARTAAELWRDDTLGRNVQLGFGPGDVAYVSDGRHTVQRHARDGQRLGELVPRRVRSVAAGPLPDGSLWSVDDAGGVLLLDGTTGAERLRASLEVAPRQAVASATRLAVVDGADVLWVFDAGSLGVIARVEGVGSIRLAPDGEHLLGFGGGRPGVRVHRLVDGDVVETVAAELGGVIAVDADRDLRVVAVLDAERAPHLLVDGAAVPLERGLERVSSLAVDPLGRWVAWGGREQEVRVHRAADGGLLTFLPMAGWWPFGVDVRALDVTADGACLLATTGDMGTVQAFDTHGWEPRWQIDYGGGNPGTVELVTDPACQRAWVWGMGNNTPRCIDLTSGEILGDLAWQGLVDVQPEADGGHAVALRDGAVVVIDQTGRLLLERLDLGAHGVLVSRLGGQVGGDAEALRRVFVRDDSGRLVRVDRWLADDER